jgi:hypothetical protein
VYLSYKNNVIKNYIAKKNQIEHANTANLMSKSSFQKYFTPEYITPVFSKGREAKLVDLLYPVLTAINNLRKKKIKKKNLINLVAKLGLLHKYKKIHLKKKIITHINNKKNLINKFKLRKLSTTLSYKKSYRIFIRNKILKKILKFKR